MEIVIVENDACFGGNEELIADLYDAAATPGEASQIPGILAKMTSSHSGAVCIFGSGEPALLTYGIPNEAIRQYGERYWSHDPWTRHTLTHARDGYFAASIGRRILPENGLVKTEFFAKFAEPFDMSEVIGGSVRVGPGVSAVYSVHRSRSVRPFESHDEAVVARLAPHLQRALQLRGRLGLRDGIGIAALDGLTIGTVVCDARGHVLFANAAAELTAKSGGAIVLGNANKPISAPRSGQRQVLLKLIHDACNGGSGGGVALTAPCARDLIVLVTPLPRRYGGAAPLALVAMPGARTGSRIEVRLSELFGLSRAEAALADLLAGGASLAEAGAQRGTTESTVRTQLRHIFRKTGTRTQSELARLIGQIPPLL